MERTPLHLSSESSHADIVNILISHGADIRVKDRVSYYKYYNKLCIDYIIKRPFPHKAKYPWNDN